MNPLSTNPTLTSPDIYTDVNSLQKLKTEKNSDAALKQVAQQFESLFTSLLLKSMRSANAQFEEDSLTSSNETQFYRDMYDQQLALQLAHGKGLGIADALYKQLSPTKKAPANTPHTALPPAPIKTLTPSAAVMPAVAATPPLSPQLDPYEENTSVAAHAGASSPINLTAQQAVESRIQFNWDTPTDFINQLMPFAKKAAAQLGVNPSVLIAQAALETGWGKRLLKDAQGNTSNNFFNIKSSNGWNGDKLEVSTLEFKNGIAQQEMAKFRQYPSIADSFQDYVNFIKTNPRYQDALNLAADAKKYIQALHGAGYATDPHYSQKIISVFQAIQAGRYFED